MSRFSVLCTGTGSATMYVPIPLSCSLHTDCLPSRTISPLTPLIWLHPPSLKRHRSFANGTPATCAPKGTAWHPSTSSDPQPSEASPSPSSFFATKLHPVSLRLRLSSVSFSSCDRRATLSIGFPFLCTFLRPFRPQGLNINIDAESDVYPPPIAYTPGPNLSSSSS